MGVFTVPRPSESTDKHRDLVSYHIQWQPGGTLERRAPARLIDPAGAGRAGARRSATPADDSYGLHPELV